MGPLFSKIISVFLDRRFWLLAGIVFLGRMCWFGYWGVLLEIDSLGYLELQANLSHPPLYALFNALLFRVVDSLEFVVVGQAIVYSLSAALLVWRQVGDHKWSFALALALAVEPLSGKLACTVMAETLFLSLILLVFALLPDLLTTEKRFWIVAALLVGILLGLAHLTRYAAPVFGVVVVIWLTMRKLRLGRLLVTGLLIFMGFQVAVFPLRVYYQVNFGTWEFNGFSSLSIWNTAAYLYPGSEPKPKNDFDRYLATLPIAKFDIYETWHTNQIFHDSCAYERYTVGMGTADKLQAAREAGRMGWRLLEGAPLRHLSAFVWPNVRRPFSKTDMIFADLLPPLILHGLHYQPHKIHVYYPVCWWIAFAALVGATGWYALRRKRAPQMVEALLLACWLYLAGIAVMTVIFLRFVYLLGPLILLALGLQIWGKAKPQSETT